MRQLLVLLSGFLIGGAATPAQAAEPLKIGVAAMISPKETFRHYREILDWVGRQLDRPVQLVQKPSYDDMDAALERREVSVAFICARPYVKNRERFGAELLVAPQSHGQPVYYSYIIVPADSPARTLADLRGTRFAFTDPGSNTGSLVPSYLVRQQFGLKAEAFFQKIIYTYSHDRSIEAVAKRFVEGAAVESLIWDYAAKENPTYTRHTRVLQRSEPYGIPPVVVHPAVEAALKERLRKVFLSMHEDPDGKRILDRLQIDRFVVPQDRDYDSVRRMERVLSGLWGG